MWIMTTDFSELTPRQTRRVVRFTEPMFLTRSSPRADWRDAKLRGKTLFVVRHFVTLMAGTARACSAVFETCSSGIINVKMLANRNLIGYYFLPEVYGKEVSKQEIKILRMLLLDVFDHVRDGQWERNLKMGDGN